MQDLIIWVFNPVYKRWIAPINEQARDFAAAFVFILFAAYFPLYHSNNFRYIIYTDTQKQFVAAVLLLLAALFSMRAPLHKISWNKWIMVPLWLGGLGIVITGILHPLGSGYLMFGLMLLTVYPAFYLVWANRGDIERLFDMIAWANVVVGVLYIVYSILILPHYPWTAFDGVSRVSATMYNSNLYSMTGATVFCCSLYLLYRVWRGKGLRRACLLALFIGLAATAAGQSRASMLVCAGALVVFFIYAAKCGRISKKAVRTVVAGCCILVLCAGIYVMLQGGTAAPAEEGAGTPSLVERFLPEGKDINSYSSGRIVIWSFYAEHLNLLGNDFTAVDRSALSVAHAHNNFLEFGFRCGVIVAGIFLLAELIAGLISLQYLFSKRKTRDHMIFCIIFMLMYAIESMVDIATIPMERYAPFFFYLMLTSMAGRKRRNTRGITTAADTPGELRIP